ncbi:MAG: TolC family protein [Amphritea sp.]|nr:TolC family protein [Amphritea sp.]
MSPVLFLFKSPDARVVSTPFGAALTRFGCLIKSRLIKPRLLILCLLSLSSSLTVAVAEEQPLTLTKALSVALQHDPWLTGSQLTQQVTEARAEASYQLPDPKFSFALASLPTDSFAIDQEAMTQLVVGVSQMYPRGDSRRLKRQQGYQQSARQPLLRREREAKLTLTVTQLWLDAYRARESIKLIEQNRGLFDQLVDISMASYTSALGQTRQQDLIQAQLEQLRVSDRLTELRQKQDMSEQQLLALLLPLDVFGSASLPVSGYSEILPQLLSVEHAALLSQPLSNQALASYLVHHPLVQALEQSISVAGTAVQLAKQQYKPEWGLSASYGYRADSADGIDRADLFSAGVTVSLPLFSSVGQDHEVVAATAQQEKIRTDRSLMIRQMIASFRSVQAQLTQLDQRQQLYRQQLLPQVNRQAQAARKAYESDNGSFAEMIRARISALNTQIDYLEIQVARQQQIAQLNYVLTTTSTLSQTVSGYALDNPQLKHTGVTP